jgi:hypothetical protein
MTNVERPVSPSLRLVTQGDEPEHRPLFTGSRFLGIAPRPVYLLPLLRIGALSTLLTPEAPDSGWAQRFATEILSLEQLTGVRRRGSRGPGRDELLNQLPTLVSSRWHGRLFTVAPYERGKRSANRWRAGIERVGARARFPTSNAAQGPTDKIAVRAWLRELGVAVPDSVVTEHLDYRALSGVLGPTFVAQRPRGAGGRGTHLVTDADTAAALPQTRRWLVSAYGGDTTVNVHGFVTGSGDALALRPSVQLANLAGTGSRFGEYSGSDFYAPTQLSGLAMSRCHDTVERIGAALGARGYRGVFGVDFAVRDDTALALEINYRTQGSSWLLGEIELAAGTTPTMLRDVLERHGYTTGGQPDLTSAHATALTIRHSGPSGQVVRAPHTGIYRLEHDQLRWLTNGCGLLECGPHDCALINLPSPGALIQPRAILARLVTPHPVTAAAGTTLTRHGDRIVRALHALFTIAEPDTHRAIDDPGTRACL